MSMWLLDWLARLLLELITPVTYAEGQLFEETSNTGFTQIQTNNSYVKLSPPTMRQSDITESKKNNLKMFLI